MDPPDAAPGVQPEAGLDGGACAELAIAPFEVPAEHLDLPVPAIEDATGESLARFYGRLAGVVRGTATDPVRIGFIGDSNLTLDLLSGMMRRMLQGKLGDAGHGFVGIGKPWRHYVHMDVEHGLDESAWYEYAVSTRKVADRMYGFSGIAAQSSQKDARAWVRTAPEGSPVGRTASRLEVHTLVRPGNGILEVKLDGAQLGEIPTDGPGPVAAVRRFEFPDGPHAVELVTRSVRPVRVLGVALERSGPGVVLDCLGIGGVSAHSLTVADAATTSASLANRRYDLVITMLGTNTVLPSTQPEAMRQLIATYRAGIPDLSLLIMSPPDHVSSFKEVHTDRVTLIVARQMREVAQHNRCGFWDFWAAMGGDGSMLAFQKKHWNMWDLYHLNDKGASYMASRLVVALWRDFALWLKKHPDAGCESQTALRASPGAPAP